jgi:hypothetical protein
MLIQRQNYHGDYACTLGRVAMSGSDGIDSYTRVSAARRAWGLWSCPIVPGSKCLCFLSLQRLVKYMRYWKLLGGVTGCLGPSWVGERGKLGRQVVKSC